MLIITNDQMDAFQRDLVLKYTRRIESYLRLNFPDEMGLMSIEAIDQLIEEGRDKAFTYGFNKVAVVERFIGYMVAYGNDFASHSYRKWMGDILRMGEVSALQKLELIDKRLQEEKK